MKNLLFIFVAFMVILMGCSKNSDPKQDINANDTSFTSSTQPTVDEKISNKSIIIQTFDNATLYRPEVISDDGFPVVLFAPGWSSQNHLDYKTLLTFIAQHGYMAIYIKSPAEYSSKISIERFSSVLEDKKVVEVLDKSKIGIVGHSSGGGIVFKLMDYFSKAGYGEDGRFIFSMDPWFAFDMSKSDLEKLPLNTHVVIQQYTNHSSTDPRIALTIFDAISTLGEENIDYQVYEDLGHGYPMGSDDFSKKQIILKPLDALINYTFYDRKDSYKLALEIGSDTPYDNYQPIFETIKYGFKCYGGNEALNKVLEEYDLDYCAIESKF